MRGFLTNKGTDYHEGHEGFLTNKGTVHEEVYSTYLLMPFFNLITLKLINNPLSVFCQLHIILRALRVLRGALFSVLWNQP